jgi:hypothetical protein
MQLCGSAVGSVERRLGFIAEPLWLPSAAMPRPNPASSSACWRARGGHHGALFPRRPLVTLQVGAHQAPSSRGRSTTLSTTASGSASVPGWGGPPCRCGPAPCRPGPAARSRCRSAVLRSTSATLPGTDLGARLSGLRQPVPSSCCGHSPVSVDVRRSQQPSGGCRRRSSAKCRGSRARVRTRSRARLFPGNTRPAAASFAPSVATSP